MTNELIQQALTSILWDEVRLSDFDALYVKSSLHEQRWTLDTKNGDKPKTNTYKARSSRTKSEEVSGFYENELLQTIRNSKKSMVIVRAGAGSGKKCHHQVLTTKIRTKSGSYCPSMPSNLVNRL